jgi:two-component system chemotaxis response regulator CheB
VAPGPADAPPRAAEGARVEAVVVAVSTGGPHALAQLLPALPRGFGAPILVVQHMPPGFSAELARNLASRSRLEVREAASGDALRPGLVLVAPGGRHLVVERRPRGLAARLTLAPPQNFCRPSADVLFRSAADALGAGALALVLTGMGHDGLLGAQAISAAGGRVVVQDRTTSVVWGMPGAVTEAGLADAVLPLAEIAGELVRRVDGTRTPRARRS